MDAMELFSSVFDIDHCFFREAGGGRHLESLFHSFDLVFCAGSCDTFFNEKIPQRKGQEV